MLIKQGKTNWKYILIVVILAAIVGGGILWLLWQEVYQGEPILPFQKVWTFEETLQKALIEKNPNLCNKINKGYIIQDFGVSAKQAQEDCKYTYAIETEDIDYCLTLSETAPLGSLSSRDVCLRGLAEKLKRPDLCDLMPCVNDEEYGESYRYNCKQAAQDETANWETYRNEEYGFEIKYPEEAELENEFPLSIHEGSKVLIDIQIVQFLHYTVDRHFIIEISDGRCSYENGELVNVNGIEFRKNISKELDGRNVSYQQTYTTTHEERCFYLTFHLYYPFSSITPEFSIDEQIKILSQILSTFRFLE